METSQNTYKKEFKLSYHITKEALPLLDTVCYQIKSQENPNARNGLNFGGGGCQKHFIDSTQILQVITSAIDHLPQTDSKVLLLKITHTSVLEQGEIKLVLSWKLHPYQLAFLALDGATTIAARGEQ